MDKLKFLILAVLSIVLCHKTAAQVVPGAFGYYNEALTFSQTDFGGTARMQAIGGAQVALGGDVSLALTNPAGLGMYNRSEVTITPGYSIQSVTADGLGMVSTEDQNQLTIQNLGIVFGTKTRRDNKKWKGGSFAITLNRVNDFNNTYGYSGANDDNSIIDFYIEQAEGISPSDIGSFGTTGLAYENYVINPTGNGNSYDSFILGLPLQAERVVTEGSQSTWNFSWGGNYDDRIYFGVGLGMLSLDYSNTKTFTETEYFSPQFPDDPTVVNRLIVEDQLEITGSGVNASAGVIIRVNDFVRIGASVISPTLYTLNETGFSSLGVDYDDFQYVTPDTTINLSNLFAETDQFASEYELTTPARFNLGASVFVGKNGFVTASAEFVNYAASKVNTETFSTSADNQTIENLYSQAVNLRLGGEYRYDIFRIRAGFAQFGDPFENSSFDRTATSISGGIGVRIKKFFADVAYVQNTKESTYSPYTLNDGTQPVIGLENKTSRGMITLGYSF